MENKELKFKANFNYGDYIPKGQSDLDNAKGICHWNVDTDNVIKSLLLILKVFIAEEEVAGYPHINSYL